jgi:hypothetical protein
LLIAPAARVVDAKIMFRVLVEILGGNSIVARRRFACQGDIALEYLMGAARGSRRWGRCSRMSDWFAELAVAV